LDQYSYNSFGIVLKKKYKQILIIKKALKSLGAKATLISGSGPCVFAVTLSRKEAMDISKKMQAQEKDWQVIVAKTYSNNSKNTDF
jgi:4-diphosphocytidyl-2C-methyl-D-erythritol kinase